MIQEYIKLTMRLGEIQTKTKKDLLVHVQVLFIAVLSTCGSWLRFAVSVKYTLDLEDLVQKILHISSLF